MKKIIFLLLFLLVLPVNANDDYKSYLKEKCNEDNLANEYEFGEKNATNAERCYLIGSAQAIYETKWGKLGAGKTHNNIYGFRANGFLYFDNKEKSIDYYVWHYYTYQYRKTISQIIKGGCYYNLKGNYVCFKGFTYTEEHQENYYKFVKKYFSNNF